MSANSILQLVVYMVVLIACAKPLGTYMANVFEGKSAVNRIFGPAERFLYLSLIHI